MRASPPPCPLALRRFDSGALDPMSTAALLARMKAQIGPVTEREVFAQGDAVEGFATRGRVAFVDDGWVYWVDELGAVRASRPSVLRRIG